MGDPQDKEKHARRRKNHFLRDSHKVFKQKDHSPDEVYDRNKYKKVEIENE